jgi:hypothetical protein
MFKEGDYVINIIFGMSRVLRVYIGEKYMHIIDLKIDCECACVVDECRKATEEEVLLWMIRTLK